MSIVMDGALKRRHIEECQLLTPHPSSNTLHAPSSPSHNGADYRILPSIQFARPEYTGEWYTIGRSSSSCDLALPSNNRLVSRVHAKLRYLSAEHAFELRCLGYNGVSLHISDQTMYVKRSTGIMVQINSEECELGLDIAGSFVQIDIPRENHIGDLDVPVPSSPACLGQSQEEEAEYELGTSAALDQIEMLSPLDSSECMITPSATPKTKRVRLMVHADSSPVQDLQRSSSPSVPQSVAEALRPRLLNFSQSSEAPEDDRGKTIDCAVTGKENIPPTTEVQIPSSPLSVHCAHSDELIEQTDFAPSQVDQTVQSVGSAIDNNEESTSKDEETAGDESMEMPNDPEFIDMILTTLATSTISPAPIASFVPFFAPSTTLNQIENFLRDQAAVSEVRRTGKDASGRALRSMWFYEPTNDDDELRRVRLARLQKPVS